MTFNVHLAQFDVAPTLTSALVNWWEVASREQCDITWIVKYWSRNEYAVSLTFTFVPASTFSQCKRDDPKVDDCIAGAIKKAIIAMKDGK